MGGDFPDSDGSNYNITPIYKAWTYPPTRMVPKATIIIERWENGRLVERRVEEGMR
jgi:hypothetical protein